MKTTRVQMELPQTSYERLVSLKERTEATSHAEVIKNALRLYEAMVERHQAGARFYVKDKDGTEISEYVVF